MCNINNCPARYGTRQFIYSVTCLQISSLHICTKVTQILYTKMLCDISVVFSCCYFYSSIMTRRTEYILEFTTVIFRWPQKLNFHHIFPAALRVFDYPKSLVFLFEVSSLFSRFQTIEAFLYSMDICIVVSE